MVKKIGLLCIVSFVLLPSCLKVENYNQKTLIPLKPHIDFKTSEQNITLRAKKFNEVNCFQLFGERGKKLITQNHKTSIYPIQISITNKSDNTYTLNKKNIALHLMPYRHVAHRMQHSTVLRSVGLLFSGTAIATLTALGGVAAIITGMATAFAPIAIIGTAACVSAPFMLVIGTPISSAMNGVQSLRNNTTIKKDVKDKSLVYQILIKPKESIDTIIFAKGRDLKENFNITLYNQNNMKEKIIINVKLKTKEQN